ncbi:MAG TPA: hypothetical protein VGZ26_08640 [Pirellulales bacterium]|jgi:hypothetical protein|nr:hypothetical protein [Pirellulales bacterium]
MTGKLLMPWLLSGIGLAVATAATAQVYSSYPSGYYRAPYYGYGGYGYGANYGAGSTVAGSYLSGLSQAIRAEGQYNLMSSAATINLEEAKKKEIESRVQWTNAYFEMRKINQAYTHPPKPSKPAPDAWVREAHNIPLPRLSPSSLDPVSGKISWPVALQGDDYHADREQLDGLFAERATTHGAIGDDNHGKIRLGVNAALEKLKGHIRDLDTQSYLDARKFLNSLTNEASFPATGSLF